MHRVECDWCRMGSVVAGRLRRIRSRRHDRLNRMRLGHGRRVETRRCGLSSPGCAPKCAPKVHGAVRAAAYHGQSTGITMAFTHEKTRIP